MKKNNSELVLELTREEWCNLIEDLNKNYSNIKEYDLKFTISKDREVNSVTHLSFIRSNGEPINEKDK